ncbi:MAG: hypothetical protein E6G94_04515 [Alphaproteobacteria bacterium]|nr:MAG: hypothetical protein E6G94_04515 [Alphaproteobacteria bacterium]
MRTRALTSVLTAAALAFAPAAGFAQSAPPSAPAPAASHEAGLALADTADDNDHDDHLVWYILGGVAVVVLLILVFSGGDGEDLPVSP